MNILKTLLASAVLAASAAGANAATYTADTLVSATAGACEGSASDCAANDRLNANNAVDGDSSTFYSLGLGGSLVVGFSEIVGSILPSTVSVFEVTFNRGTSHAEAADVYAIDESGSESLLGRITNRIGESSVFASSAFQYLKLVDVSEVEFPETTSFDGYDVAKIAIAPVPLPAGGLLLLGGLGGLAALRRRKKAA